MILSVPFRNQSETLTNLKDALTPGQLLIDATVPLAAAVSGKATRMLGVWQGSAAQQAPEMAPEGVRVVSALHTVSAASLSDLEHPLDQDVLRVRRLARGQARGGAADRAHRRPALRRLRAPGDVAHHRVADRAADRRQRRYKAHAGIRAHRPARPAGSEHGGRGATYVVVLAGGTGGAKLARGMADVVGAERLAAIANTGDDIEIYGAHVSPDPDLVSFWLADLIDERGWGLREDTFAVMDALRALGVGGLVQPRRPRPRLVPGARAHARRRRLRRRPRWRA